MKMNSPNALASDSCKPLCAILCKTHPYGIQSIKHMRQILFFLLVALQFPVFGQKVIHGIVLSAIDGTPVTNFLVKKGKKHIVVTDGEGTFSFLAAKKKIALSFHYTMTETKDTTIILSDTTTRIFLFTYKTLDSSQAKYDIENNNMILFCCLGFNVLHPTRNDEAFEKKYGVKYFVMGDSPPAPINKLHSYNLSIAKYLDARYGTEWRKKTKAYL